MGASPQTPFKILIHKSTVCQNIGRELRSFTEYGHQKHNDVLIVVLKRFCSFVVFYWVFF